MTNQIYLLSLLRHIPEPIIQTRFKTILETLGAKSTRATQILDLSEALARGNQPATPTQILRSPLECLSGNTPRHSISFQALDLTDKNFPSLKVDGGTAASELWESFAADFARIPDASSLEVRAETSLHLLHRYAANLPNSCGAAAEISWYDFAKNTAGIAVALDAYLGEEQEVQLLQQDKPFLLIGGDLSGIQHFITAIVSKGASKNLKGRSFYLQMLTESVVTLLLHDLRLVRANVVYASGGSFYLIAPNTVECQDAFKVTSKKIGDKIYQQHKNALALIMDNIEVSRGDMNHVQACFDSLMEKLDVKKLQKNPHIILSYFEDMFSTGVDAGGTRRRDAISGEEISDNEEFFLEDESKSTGYKYQPKGVSMPEGKDILKTTTFEQIVLGRQLRNLNYWAFSLDKPTYSADTDNPQYFDPCNLGVFHSLQKNKSLSKATVLSINEVSAFLPNNPDPHCIYGFTFYGGNQAPSYTDKTGENKLLEFSLMTVQDSEDLSKAGDKIEKESSFGYFRRLGVLRMDVDNLGAIFREGVSGNRSTFAFYSSLSRSLDCFFKGYLNTIWKNEGFSERSQIIYSGGDDLFIVGRWDLMLRFAKKIANDFRRFAGENPTLGISGGVAIVTHKFPVIKASALAGVAEKKAKKHNNGQGGEKNSLTLMGEPLDWRGKRIGKDSDCEYAIVDFLRAEIKRLGDSDVRLGRGFCQRIQAYHSMKVILSKRPKGSYERTGDQFRWKWLVAYDFARLKQRLKLHNNSEEAKFLDALQEWTFTGRFQNKPLPSQYDFMDLLNVAARWAELEYRSQD